VRSFQASRCETMALDPELARGATRELAKANQPT